jgi:wyosine [tRNA(Phe)-imidazoG37] synthetase (radical SAM superfamily)
VANGKVAKLDAPDERLFRLINRPVGHLSLEEIVDGIRRFRSQWGGTLALQMMFLAANKRAAEGMAALAAGLSPDEVQVNTPLRPSAAAPCRGGRSPPYARASRACPCALSTRPCLQR